MKLTEISERIHAHLKRFEADKVLTVSKRQLCWNPGAFHSGSRVMCCYVSYQGQSSLTKTEAIRYLEKLDSGFVGRHFEAFREPEKPSSADIIRTDNYNQNQKLRRYEIEAAVSKIDADAVLKLLADEFDNGIELLGAGFGAKLTDIKRESFASLCIAAKAEVVLEAVLRSNLADPSVILKAVCTYMHSRAAKDGTFEPPSENHQTLTYTAMAAKSVAGTMLALEFEADAPKMKSAEASHLNGVAMSYHAEALRAALSCILSSEEKFMQAVQVCRCYIEKNLPTLQKTNGETGAYNCALFEFCDTTGYHSQTQMGSFFKEYLAAGYFGDLNSPLKISKDRATSISGRNPLAGAILRNNIPIAVELILAGADTSLVGDEAGRPGIDIVELVREQNKPDVEEAVAKLNHALMTRVLQVKLATQTQDTAPALSHRRNMAV